MTSTVAHHTKIWKTHCHDLETIARLCGSGTSTPDGTGLSPNGCDTLTWPIPEAMASILCEIHECEQMVAKLKAFFHKIGFGAIIH